MTLLLYLKIWLLVLYPTYKSITITYLFGVTIVLQQCTLFVNVCPYLVTKEQKQRQKGTNDLLHLFKTIFKITY